MTRAPFRSDLAQKSVDLVVDECDDECDDECVDECDDECTCVDDDGNVAVFHACNDDEAKR